MTQDGDKSSRPSLPDTLSGIEDVLERIQGNINDVSVISEVELKLKGLLELADQSGLDEGVDPDLADRLILMKGMLEELSRQTQVRLEIAPDFGAYLQANFSD